MGDIKVRNLSELLKVIVESSECSENYFHPIQASCDAVKEEICEACDVETKVEIKEEPTDDCDMNDSKIFPFTDAKDEQFKLVQQLMKRTIKMNQCTCNKCGSICDSINDLRLHMNQCPNRHNQTACLQIVCVRCSDSFATYRQRQHHMFIHRNVPPLVCRYCNKCSENVSEAQRHAKYTHINRSGSNPKFVCRICFMLFYRATPYERHLRVHNDSFKCTICFQRFVRLNAFQEHLLQMHDRGMEVKQQDSEGFFDRGTVKREPKELVVSSVHQTFIKSEDSTANLEFSVKQEPVQSKGIDGPFRCDRCADSSQNTPDYLDHMKRHMTSLKKIDCLHCRRFHFKSKQALKRHNKKFHPNAPSKVESVDREPSSRRNSRRYQVY